MPTVLRPLIGSGLLVSCLLVVPGRAQRAVGFTPPDDVTLRSATITSEGTRMVAEVYAPKSPASEKLPTIIMSHGWGGVAANLRPDFSGRWNLGITTGPIFATGKYHEYYYGVDPQFATAQRPAYSARGGYSGWMGLVSLSRRYQRLWVGAFARYDALRGAVFDDSPLVRRQSSWMAGIAAAWVFAESDRMVDVFEPYY